MARWTPSPMDLIPAKNSNKDFIKCAVSFAHCGLKIMARWTLGSKNLIQAINSNNDFVKYAVFFCSLWIQIDNGLQNPRL